jgi:hypothetical protein
MIHGPLVEEGLWRIKTYQELRQLYKDLDIAADIKNERLEWLEHMIRTDRGRS